MSEFNFLILNGNEKEGDCELFFGCPKEEVVQVPIDSKWDMFDILVCSGIFPSKGQARKNWKKTDGEIPAGFSDFAKLGKLNCRITILNPIGEQ
jgi:hypothetical protein